MAIKRYSGDRFTGLSSDTKPTGVEAGAIFTETDTNTLYQFDGSSWNELAYASTNHTHTESDITDLAHYTDADLEAHVAPDGDFQNLGEGDVVNFEEIVISNDWRLRTQSNASINRLVFDPAGNDQNVEGFFAPSGVATTARLYVSNSSNANNFSGVGLISNSTYNAVRADAEGSGTPLPLRIEVQGANSLTFWTNGVQRGEITGAGDTEFSGTLTAPNTAFGTNNVLIGSVGDGRYSQLGHGHPFSDISGTITDGQHGNRGGGSLHANATTSVAGFMSSADKTKLNGIESGAEVNTVDSVNGQTGAVSLSLGNLSNVVLTSPSTDDFLQYNGTNWVNAAVSAGSFNGGTITNALIIDVGGDGLQLKSAAQDHVYMEFFADSDNPNTRSGYFGYPSAGSPTMLINNQTSNGSLILRTNNINRVTIGSSGNVGIGTTSPAELLHVDGNVKIDQGLYGDGGLDLYADNNMTFNIDTADLGSRAFTWRSTSSFTDIMRLSQGGTLSLFYGEGTVALSGTAGGNKYWDLGNFGTGTSGRGFLRLFDDAGTAGVSMDGNGDVDVVRGGNYRFGGRNDLGMYSSGFQINLKSADNVYVSIDANNNNTDRAFIINKNSSAFGGGTEVFRVNESGNTTANNFIATSDGRIKSNESPVSNALYSLRNIIPYHFDKEDQRKVGYIAQNVEQFTENVVFQVERNGYNNFRVMDTMGMQAYNTAAIKELDRFVMSNKQRIEQLEKEIERLRGK